MKLIYIPFSGKFFIGRKVFIIPMQLVGIIRNYDPKADEFFVTTSTRKTSWGDWFKKEEVRLWTKEISQKCGFDRVCWEKYGQKINWEGGKMKKPFPKIDGKVLEPYKEIEIDNFIVCHIPGYEEIRIVHPTERCILLKIGYDGHIGLCSGVDGIEELKRLTKLAEKIWNSLVKEKNELQRD